MEDYNMNNPSDKVPVNATLIVSKYKSLKDRLNFCFEKNWYHPREVGFDTSFFLKVIMGQKKYLPNNFTINYTLHYFRKGEKLDKDYIISRMKDNPAYAEYTPDIGDPKKFSKSFLLLLIAYIDPSLYRELYSINKKQLQERIYNKWGDYQIDISKELIKDIKDFIPTDSQTNSKGGFRRTKNSVSCNTFYKFKNINENDGKENEKSHIMEKEKKNLEQKLLQLDELNRNNQKKNEQLEFEKKTLLLKLQEMEKERMNMIQAIKNERQNELNSKKNTIKIRVNNELLNTNK